LVLPLFHSVHNCLDLIDLGRRKIQGLGDVRPGDNQGSGLLEVDLLDSSILTGLPRFVENLLEGRLGVLADQGAILTRRLTLELPLRIPCRVARCTVKLLSGCRLLLRLKIPLGLLLGPKLVAEGTTRLVDRGAQAHDFAKLFVGNLDLVPDGTVLTELEYV